MPSSANPDEPAPDDEKTLRLLAETLADGIERELKWWVLDRVVERMTQWSGSASNDLQNAAEEAGDEATRIVAPAVRALLLADVDEQGANPLSLVRSLAVPYATRVLQRFGVPPVVRDGFAERAFPDDPYDLSPAAFADISPRLHDPGVAWGAAKAYVVLARRRAEGLR